MKRTIFFLSILCFFSLEAENIQKNPPPSAFDADLFKRDDQVFSFHGEFLFWRVDEGALDYALKMKQPAWGPSNSYAQGDFQKTEYNGDPGFRLKASFFRATRYWELWGQYTRFTGHGKNSVGKPGPDQEYITGTWPQVLSSTLASASSSIHLNYNVFDFLVDRFFNPNPHLRLRLIGGALVVWMDQDWKIHYKDFGSGLTKVRNRWNYVGGGFRIGTMVDWYWCYDIYFTALSTTGLTMGSYCNQAEQKTNTALQAGDDPNIPVRNAKYEDLRPALTVQIQFGPSWQKNFPRNRLEIFAGYELNTWFNVQEVYRSTAATAPNAKETWINTGLVSLQGLTTRMTLDF